MNPKDIDLIIDSGHGGRDPGGGSNSRFKEKDKVLEISLEQRRLFKKVGINPKMTRTNDKYLSPKQRTNIIKNSGAKYCISNHINSFNSDAKGAEVAHSIFSNGKWARLTLDELVKAGAHKRRVFTRTYPGNKKLDYYYMHRDTGSVETIIVEHNFASNKEDTEKLLKNWKEYALADVIAFCKYVGVDYSKLLKEGKPKTYYQLGDKGQKVKDLQNNLIEVGFQVGKYGADGVFGQDTRQAIIAFQNHYKLSVDGIAGKETLAKIKELLEKKDDSLYKVQVGAFSDKENAEKQAEKLKKQGFNSYIKKEKK